MKLKLWIFCLLGNVCFLHANELVPSSVSGMPEDRLWQELSVVAQRAYEEAIMEPDGKLDPQRATLLRSEEILTEMVNVGVLQEENFVLPIFELPKDQMDEKIKKLNAYLLKLAPQYGNLSSREMLGLGARFYSETFTAINLKVRLPKDELVKFSEYVEKEKLGYKSKAIIREAQIICENIYSTLSLKKITLKGNSFYYERAKASEEQKEQINAILDKAVKHGVLVKVSYTFDKDMSYSEKKVENWFQQINGRYGKYLAQEMLGIGVTKAEYKDDAKKVTVQMRIPFEDKEQLDGIINSKDNK